MLDLELIDDNWYLHLDIDLICSMPWIFDLWMKIINDETKDRR